MDACVGIIGGTGLYQWPGLNIVEKKQIDTPYGATSAALVFGNFANHRLVFLARHGEQHQWAPHRVNYRANLWALHQQGVRSVLAINAVGGITAEMVPKALVIPHQLIDYTHGRLTSYCDIEHPKKVDHVDLSEPYTQQLRLKILNAAAELALPCVDYGVYGVTQGPRLETAAEIVRMARDGCDLVGMTSMPEAALARELQLDYVCLAIVANWAAGCGINGVGSAAPPISLDEIYENVRVSSNHAAALVAQFLKAA